MDPLALKPAVLVRVTWVDSDYTRGWHYPAEETGEYKLDLGSEITSVGLVVKANERSLVLSSSLSDSGGVLCPLSIPWGMIQRLEEL